MLPMPMMGSMGVPGGGKVGGFGPELVSNGTFNVDTTGWTPTSADLTLVAAGMRVTNTAAAVGSAQQPLVTQAGRTYRATLAYTSGTAASVTLRFGSTSLGADVGALLLTAPSPSLQFTAVGAMTYLNFRLNNATAGLYFDVDDVSVREIL